VATAQVLVPTAARITPDVLDAAKELRLICQAGTGELSTTTLSITPAVIRIRTFFWIAA
jgi:phosphoglycerate dehydrogenase-like enzyme